MIQKGSSIHTYLYQWWFLLRQAGGAEKGRSEALWRAAAEAGGPGNRQGREQTDRSGYLKAQLLRPADIRGLVSEHYQLINIEHKMYTDIFPIDSEVIGLFQPLFLGEKI